MITSQSRFINMTNEEKAITIRAMVTATCIAQYKLLQLKDNTHHVLKQKVSAAIKACDAVEKYFLIHPDTTDETRERFKEQFLSDEIVLLSELLETCFGISADGLEEIIKAIKQNAEPQQNPL